MKGGIFMPKQKVYTGIQNQGCRNNVPYIEWYNTERIIKGMSPVEYKITVA